MSEIWPIEWDRHYTPPDELGNLTDGNLTLRLREREQASPDRRWVASLKFDMVHIQTDEILGFIQLRLGDTHDLYYHGGHIGYAVEESHRGNRYAARSVAMLLPLAWKAGMPEIWISCNPENLASSRSIEIAGGNFVETRNVEKTSPMYEQGHRIISRYQFKRPGPILEGNRIRLIPLGREHWDVLTEIGLDSRLWERTTISVETKDQMRQYIENAFRTDNLPFVIQEKSTGQIIGTTRFQNISNKHASGEIGFTWIGIPWQRKRFNLESKLLMLRYAFEVLKCNRVEFKADSENTGSRSALSALGAKQEAIFRSYMISDKRGVRDLAVYSIMSEEWNQVKSSSLSKLNSSKIGEI